MRFWNAPFPFFVRLNGLRIAPSAGMILFATTPVLSLLMVLRVRYPKLRVSKAAGVPEVVVLLCLPFVVMKLRASFILCVVLA